MRVVFTEAYAASANTTIRAVVDLLSRVVVPELADVAIIACRLYTTLNAGIRGLLWSATGHTEHVLRGLAVQRVVFDFVVAVSARVPVPAIIALDLDIALVVLTPQNKLLFDLILLIFVVVVFDCPICRAGVSRPQLVGVLQIDVRGSGER